MSKTIAKAMEYHNRIVESIERLPMGLKVEEHAQILQALSMIAIAEELQNITRKLDSIGDVIANK